MKDWIKNHKTIWTILWAVIFLYFGSKIPGLGGLIWFAFLVYIPFLLYGHLVKKTPTISSTDPQSTSVTTPIHTTTEGLVAIQSTDIEQVRKRIFWQLIFILLLQYSVALVTLLIYLTNGFTLYSEGAGTVRYVYSLTLFPITFIAFLVFLWGYIKTVWGNRKQLPQSVLIGFVIFWVQL